MSKFFSPTTRGIYDDALRADYDAGGTWPADAVPLPDDTAAALAAGQARGLAVGTGVNGQPMLIDPPETHDAAQARALVLLRDQRGPILSILDGIQATANTQWLGAFTSADATVRATADSFKAQAQQVETLKQGLRDAPTKIDWAACADFAAMRLAGKAYYLSLVQGAPANVVTAFQSVA